MTRHASVHAAGVVIAPRPLTEFVPLYKSQKDEGEITTQWAMKEIERVGLLKMDFLGLSTLTLLDDAVKHIKETTGDDDRPRRRCRSTIAKTYQLFQNGQTHGVFQFESSGMRDTLRKAKPQCLEDLIALNALYRPGPLRGGVVDDYIARKHGRVEVKYELPQMEPRAQGDLRRHRVPGTGHAPRERAGRLHAGPGRRAAPRDGQEGRGEDAGAARGLHERLHGARHRGEEGHARSSSSSSTSPATASTSRTRRPTRCSRIRRRISRRTTRGTSWRRCSRSSRQNTDKVALYLAECRELGVPDAAARHQRERAGSSSSQPEGVRFGLGAVKGAGEGAIQSLLETRDDARRPHHVAVRAGRARRPAAREQEGARVPDQGRRVRLARAERAATTTWRGARGCSPGSIASSTTAAVTSAIATRASRSSSAASDDADERRRRRCRAAGRRGRGRRPRRSPFEKEALGLYMSGPSAPALRGRRWRRPARSALGGADAVGGRRARSAASSPGLRQLKTKRATAWPCSCSRTRPARSRRWCSRRPSAGTAALIVDDAMLLVRGKFERDEETSRLVVDRDHAARRRARARGARSRDHAGRQGPRDATPMRDAGGRARAPSRATAASRCVVRGQRRAAARCACARRTRAGAFEPSEPFVREVEAVCGAGIGRAEVTSNRAACHA